MRFHPDYAGPPLRFQRYARGFASRGIDLRVFTARWTSESEASGARSREPPFTIEGIPVQRVRLSTGSPKSMRVRYDRALVDYLTGSRPRPDVLQILDVTTWSAPWTWKLRFMDLPIVYTHTMIADPTKGHLKRLFDNAAFRLVDRVVVSSTVMRDDLEAHGVKVPIRVIPNGVDLDRFRPLHGPGPRRDLRARLALPVDGPLVVFVGGFLNYRKGLDLLAEAWTSISTAYPDASLVLVGPHHNDMRPSPSQNRFLAKIEASLAASGAKDRVVMTGRVQNVGDYLAVADVFVFPSRREGMPNVVVEAYASGAPVVMTPFVGLPNEFGLAGREHLLVPHDPVQIGQAVNALLADAGRREALSKAARTWVERSLGVDRALDSYADLYRELAGGPIGRGSA